MKIIRISTLLHFGGLEQRLVNLSKVQDNNEWIFCAIGSGGTASEQILNNGKQVILLNLSYSIPSRQAIKGLIDLFKIEKPDVVHTSGAEANFHGIISAKIAGIKTIVAEEIGIPNQSRLVKFVFSGLYIFSSSVIANSNQVGEYLRKENKVSEKKLQIIPNPVPDSNLNQIASSSDFCFHLVTVSRLKAVKNIKGILEVISILFSEGAKIKFSLIGDGDEQESLEACVVSLGLDNIVEFKGYHLNPWSTVEEANLFILNSNSEGFSNALAEAMAMGIPCLATRVGAAEDLISDGENGWLVPPNDNQALHEKLRYIIRIDKNELLEIGKKGKIHIQNRYSLQRHVSALLQVYKS
jgi:glycosyltransferase involved in cell wall biosynthesis